MATLILKFAYCVLDFFGHILFLPNHSCVRFAPFWIHPINTVVAKEK